MAGLQRNRHIGHFYDILSLERILYSKPRRHLHELIGPLPATSILDVGCGTGLNSPVSAIWSDLAVTSSASMPARA